VERASANVGSGTGESTIDRQTAEKRRAEKWKWLEMEMGLRDNLFMIREITLYIYANQNDPIWGVLM
jgi:hypothetical protein